MKKKLTKKRRFPQEMLLMNDCPNCGQECNTKFVENVIDEIVSLEAEQEKARIVEILKQRQKGWFGLQEDGSQRHLFYDEIDTLITLINNK